MLWTCWVILLAATTTAVYGVRLNPSEYPRPPFKSKCRLLINEINFHTDNPSEKQFVELSRYCKDKFYGQRTLSLKTFKLIFITHDGYLSGVCSLNGDLKPKTKIIYDPEKQDPGPLSAKKAKMEGTYWFFTIGHGYSDMDMDISDCQTIPTSRTDSSKTRFPMGSQYPVALAVVQHERPDTISDIKLEKVEDRYVKTIITPAMENMIMWYLQDMYVYGSNTMYQYCDYFGKYFAYENEIGSLLRDWNVHGETDRSLSRCSKTALGKQILPFQPSLFSYAIPSPGEINLCKTAAKFRIEDTQEHRDEPMELIIADDNRCYSFTSDNANNLGLITSDLNFRSQLHEGLTGVSLEDSENEPVTQATGIDAAPSGPEQCRNNVERIDIADDEDYEFDDNGDTAAGHTGASSGGFQFSPIDQKTFEDNLELEKPYVWTDCLRFDENKQDEIDSIPLKPLLVKDVLEPDVCNWIEYLKDENKFRCKLCNKLLTQSILFDRPRSQSIPDIVTKGVMNMHPKNRKFNNRELISDHKDSIYHQIALQWFRLYDQGLRQEDLKNEFEDGDGLFKTYIGSTRNMIAMVRQAVLMGITFHNFEYMTDLVEFFGGDIGDLYRNPTGMRTIVKSISSKMHDDFIDFLLKNSPKIGLLVDGTTDTSGHTVVIFLFMTSIPGDGIKVRLYKVVELLEGEKGQQIFDALKEQLIEDSLLEFFVQNLNSVTSDGALSMYSVFNTRIRALTGRPIVRIWCQNHKQDLAYKHTLNDHSGLKILPLVVNRCSRMFNNKSPKRKNVLRTVTKELGGKPFEVKRTHKIRWVAGNLRGYVGLIKHWKYIVTALLRLEGDMSFPDETRSEASDLLTYLLDPTFLANLAFLCDVSEIMADVSLRTQTLGKTLIGKRDMRTQLLASIRSLHVTNSPELLSLIGESDADSLRTFEIYKGTELMGIKLNNPKPRNLGKRLFEAQSTYLETLTAWTKHYFPEDEQDEYDVFNPKKFPRDQDQLRTYALTEIETLNVDLQWGFDTPGLLSSWTRVLLNVTQHSLFQVKRMLTPEEFWAFYLNPTIHVDFDDNSRGMLENVLAISASNAETERAFGIFARIKTKQRYLLKTGMVDAILRIKINDDDNIHTFDTMPIAKNFVLSGHSRVNDKTRTTSRMTSKQWDAVVADDFAIMRAEDDDEDLDEELENSFGDDTFGTVDHTSVESASDNDPGEIAPEGASVDADEVNNDSSDESDEIC